MSHYCHIHGEYPQYKDGCPGCQEAVERSEERAREAEERAEEAEERAEERARDMIYKRANPGDYECPACKYVTLRRDASRCPMCHATIEDQYWSDVRSAETRAAEERERARVKAAAKARAEAEENARAARADAAVKTTGTIVGLILLLIIALIIAFNDQRAQRAQPLQAKRLDETVGSAKVVSGRPGETITVIAPADGTWVKVCGQFDTYPSADVYVRVNGFRPERLDGPEILPGNRPGALLVGERCFVLRSAGDEPVAVGVRFYAQQRTVSIPAKTPPDRQMTTKEAVKLEGEMAQARAARISKAEERLRAAETAMASAKAKLDKASAAAIDVSIPVFRILKRPDGTLFAGPDPETDQIRAREAEANADYEAAKRAYTDAKAEKQALVENRK